jgi:SAM-dependent methyltransferase
VNLTPATSIDHLDALCQAVALAPPLDGLDPDAYAKDHAAFEGRSNQRGLIADWLVNRLAEGDPDSVSVLSVGCGDGALDALVAARILDGPTRERRVRYVGIEPFDGSAAQFTRRMASIAGDSLSTSVHVSHFADAHIDEPFDAVTFVHSMYYVPDIVDAVHKAAHHARDGGEVLVLSAPRGDLNRLAGLLAPTLEGHRQWFSDDVREALEGSDLAFTVAGTIEAVVDLTDADVDVLDFTVQACLTPDLRALVRRYLADVSLVPGRSVVAHPVDVYIVKGRSGREGAQFTG